MNRVKQIERSATLRRSGAQALSWHGGGSGLQHELWPSTGRILGNSAKDPTEKHPGFACLSSFKILWKKG